MYKTVGALIFAVLMSPMRIASAADVASAAPDGGAERRARRNLGRAEVHFRAGRFYEALIEYEAGYQESPLPGFLINIAQCYRRLGDLPRARTTYQKFVAIAPHSPLVAEVRSLIRELDQLISDLGEPAKPEAPDPVPVVIIPPPPAVVPLVVRPPLNTTILVKATAPPPEPVRWGLWGGTAAVVVGGAVASFFFLSAPRTQTVHDGSIGSLRR